MMNSKQATYVHEWVRLIRPLFPKRARIVVETGERLVVNIDWKLGTDPTRPYKRSRLIRLVLPRASFDDTADMKKAGVRFRELVEERLALFNPDHKTARCGRPPHEEWVIEVA